MTSTRFARAVLACRRVDTPLGPVLLAASADGLAGLWFEGQKHQPEWPAATAADAPRPAQQAMTRWLDQAEAALARYFGGTPAQAFAGLPLDLSHGTEGQRRVWQALRRIGCGQTLSYGALAQAIGQPAAVRAVAAAVGRNPLSIAVPCHRVLGRDGSLTGYAGGLPRKQALLTLEGAWPRSGRDTRVASAARDAGKARA